MNSHEPYGSEKAPYGRYTPFLPRAGYITVLRCLYFNPAVSWNRLPIFRYFQDEFTRLTNNFRTGFRSVLRYKMPNTIWLLKS